MKNFSNYTKEEIRYANEQAELDLLIHNLNTRMSSSLGLINFYKSNLDCTEENCTNAFDNYMKEIKIITDLRIDNKRNFTKTVEFSLLSMQYKSTNTLKLILMEMYQKKNSVI